MTSKMIALRILDTIIIAFPAILALSMAGLPLAGAAAAVSHVASQIPRLFDLHRRRRDVADARDRDVRLGAVER